MSGADLSGGRISSEYGNGRKRIATRMQTMHFRQMPKRLVPFYGALLLLTNKSRNLTRFLSLLKFATLRKSAKKKS